jgi:hypothetical protein
LSNIDRFFGQVSTIKEISALWSGAAAAQIAAE